MNPDVAGAVRELRTANLLSEEHSRHLGRVASGQLVSLRIELRLALYAGVALVAAGAGVLIRENLDRIGPAAVAVVLGLVAAGCLVWVHRTAPHFTWERRESAHVAFDYLLLLGILLASADLAYVEAQFTPLGESWPWHLLIASLFTGFLAFRYDSRVAFSLALSTFAAWRGVSVSFLEEGFWDNFETAARLNTAGCGLLFVLLGAVLRRARAKPHFEPVATYLGWILVLLALASGALAGGSSHGAYTAVLLVLGALLALRSLRTRRFPLFAMGAAAAYVALGRWVVPALDGDRLVILWFLVTSLLAIAALVRVHRMLDRAP